MSTQSDYRITVTVDGRSLGVFDARSGGEVSADIAKRNTGEGPKTYPGKASPADLTVTRGYERARDHELCRWLEKRAGRAQMTISEQPLDEDGVVWGKPKTWTGRLQSVNTGEVDADSGDPRDMELGMVAAVVS